MSRSNIGIYNQSTQQLKMIYCHYNGYLDGNGKTLLENYSDISKIQELISLGHLSSLEKHISAPAGVAHGNNGADLADDVCVFFDRDMGEKDNNAMVFENVDIDKLIKHRQKDYLYVFIVSEDNPTGYWTCADYQDATMATLTAQMVK